jgi:hypothetical protein
MAKIPEGQTTNLSQSLTLGSSGGTGDLPGWRYAGISSDFITRQPSNQNFLQPTGFKFNLAFAPAVTFFCQSANLPGIDLGMVEQQTRFGPLDYTGLPTFEDLEVRFLIDENLENWLEIYNWIQRITTSEDHGKYIPTMEHYTEASLLILTSAMNTNFRINFKNVIPKTLSGIEFDSSVAGIDGIVATCTFSFSRYEITNV